MALTYSTLQIREVGWLFCGSSPTGSSRHWPDGCGRQTASLVETPVPGVRLRNELRWHQASVSRTPQMTSRVTCMAKEKKAKGPGKKASKASSVPEPAAPPPPPPEPYTQGDVIMYSLALIDSYFRATGKQIFPQTVEISAAAQALWELPGVLISHGTEEDPIFNYGNKAALDLMEMDWGAFTSLPSHKSAEEGEQQNRNQLIASAVAEPRDISGIVRVTSSGRRFRVTEGTLWPVTTSNGDCLGQAAIFRSFEFLDEDEEEQAVCRETSSSAVPSQESSEVPTKQKMETYEPTTPIEESSVAV